MSWFQKDKKKLNALKRKNKSLEDQLAQMSKIAEKAVESAEEQKEPPVKYTTLRTFNPDDVEYLQNIGSHVTDDTWLFFENDMKQKIMDKISACQYTDSEAKLRHIFWLEGIEWFLLGIREAQADFQAMRTVEEDTDGA